MARDLLDGSQGNASVMEGGQSGSAEGMGAHPHQPDPLAGLAQDPVCSIPSQLPSTMAAWEEIVIY